MSKTTFTKEQIQEVIKATGFVQVQEAQRPNFFPEWIKNNYRFLFAENAIYETFGEWIKGYNGTYLEFYKTPDGKYGFVVPTLKSINETIAISNPNNWFDGELNMLQLGIAASLVSLNRIAWLQGSGPEESEMYHQHNRKLLLMLNKMSMAADVRAILD